MRSPQSERRQLARHHTARVQRAICSAQIITEKHSVEIATAGLVGGGLTLAFLLLQRKCRVKQRKSLPPLSTQQLF